MSSLLQCISVSQSVRPSFHHILHHTYIHTLHTYILHRIKTRKLNFKFKHADYCRQAIIEYVRDPRLSRVVTLTKYASAPATIHPSTRLITQKVWYDIQRYGENDGRILLRRDRVQCLQVAQLKRNEIKREAGHRKLGQVLSSGSDYIRRTWSAEGLSEMTSAASRRALEAFCSPSAAMTLARASRAASASAAIARCNCTGRRTSLLQLKIMTNWCTKFSTIWISATPRGRSHHLHCGLKQIAVPT